MFICPKCQAIDKVRQARHMGSKAVCTECDFVIRDEGSTINNKYVKPSNPDLKGSDKLTDMEVYNWLEINSTPIPDENRFLYDRKDMPEILESYFEWRKNH